MQTQKQLEARMNMERSMVRHMIRTAIAHGYAVTKVDDGEEIVKCANEAQAMDAVFAVDESHIYFRHPEEEKNHCAFIVLGNDGWDAIADNSQGGKWDAVMKACDEHSDKLCEEASYTMTTATAQREILTLAAKAAGLVIVKWEDDAPLIYFDKLRLWNPIDSNDQAKNLRHRLQLTTGFDDRFTDLGPCAYATYPTGQNSCNSVMQSIEQVGGSKNRAFRLSIVRAAAEVGKLMP